MKKSVMGMFKIGRIIEKLNEEKEKNNWLVMNLNKGLLAKVW